METITGWYVKFSQAVRSNCIDQNLPEDSVDYWRDVLFSRTVALVIPFSLLTVIPGVWYCLLTGLYLLATLDLLAYGLLLFVAFSRRIPVEVKKFLFLSVVYITGISLVFYAGAHGPGLLFLLAACVFGLLIMHRRYAYFWSGINTVIVTAFTFVIHYDLSPVASANEMSVGEWIAISVNLVFLSIFSSALIPLIFNGLSQVLQQKKELQLELKTQNEEKDIIMAELEVKNEDLEQFAYTASHDLQEPLRMITSFMGLLDKNYSERLDDKARKYIYFAGDGAMRMKSIIADLLDYSRAGSFSGDSSQVDFNEVMSEYLVLRKELIEDTGAQITWDELPTIQGWKAACTQVMNNLLDNAIKYRKQGVPPIIHVSAEELPSLFKFTVRDNGRGIAPDDFYRVFVIFQRLKSGSEPESEGTGLGLAVVKKIVERQGGKVWIESEKGAGTVFNFTMKR